MFPPARVGGERYRKTNNSETVMKRAVILTVCLLLVIGVLFYCGTGVSQTTEAWTDDLTSEYDQDIGHTWWTWVKPFIENKVAEGDSAAREMSPLILGRTLEEEGRILLAVRNKAGSTLSLGDVAVYDSTRITVCDTTKEKAARIEIDLSDEGGWLNLYVVADGTASNDTLDIYGLDEDGASQSENLAITDGANSYTRSAYRWTQIDSVSNADYTGGWDSYDVYALAYCGVIAGGGATYDFAGIVAGRDSSGTWVDYIIDNAVGFIAISGVSPAVVDGNSTAVFPGMLLEMAASADLAPFAHTDSLDYKSVVARALEPAFIANETIDVFVNP